MNVSFDEQYITVDYQDNTMAMLAWQELEKVEVSWFAGKAHWVLSGNSALQAIEVGCQGERKLQDALAQLHQFDAQKARQLLANSNSELTTVWFKR